MAGCASATTNARVADVQSDRLETSVAVATFDSAWSIVRETYIDTAFVAGRWNAVHTSLRPRALEVTTRAGLDSLLGDMLAEIHDSHFYLIPPSVASEVKDDDSGGSGTTGMSVRIVDDGALVWRVVPGSPADLAGARPGQSVEKINDRVVRESVKKVLSLKEGRQRALSDLDFKLNAPLSPVVGGTVRVSLTALDGKSFVANLVGIPKKGVVSKFGNMPATLSVVTVDRRSEGSRCSAGIIGFNIWLPILSPEIAKAVKSVATCEGIVIDLRGNPGGVGAMVMGVGGFFVSSPVSLGTMRTRDLSLNFALNPQQVDSGPYSGPVAILVDAMSASTSEIFATGMQRIGRARVFGQRSAAAALPALMSPLPSGDIFVHAVADFTDPRGGRIEGAGVTPDEIVPITAADLSKNIDAPLEAAIRWIQGLRHKS
ncbi:MAG TPA: S41 family peptidase [Gemmatimonadaceae bacterium]|nr:S41 family peptidase [Gemmatimonadaceae bacterium]